MRTRTNLLDFSVASEESRQRAGKEEGGLIANRSIYVSMSGHQAGVLIYMVAAERTRVNWKGI